MNVHQQGREFCEEHQYEITHLYAGNEPRKLQAFCKECLIKNILKENEIISISAAVSQASNLTNPSNKYFSAMKTWLSSMMLMKKTIVGIHENQIRIIESLIHELKELIEKEERVFQNLISNVHNLDILQLKIFSQVYISLKQTSRISSYKLEQELQQKIQQFFSKEEQFFHEYQIQISNLQTKLKNFFQEVNNQHEQVLLTQELKNKEIHILSYSEKTEIVVTVHANIMSLYPFNSGLLRYEKNIETEHSFITFLAFADYDNKNKLYLAGEEKQISAWQWNNQSQIYVFEKKISIDAQIIKMILYNDYEKIMIFSENQIRILDLQKMKVDYQLPDFGQKLFCEEVFCSDISNSGLFLICSVFNRIILWKKFSQWKIQIQISCEKQTSICFTHNSEFVTINQEGKIKSWQLAERNINLLSQFDAQSSQLLYCGCIKALVCFNENSYKLYSIRDRSFALIVERKGKNMKLCTSIDGQILVIFDQGTLTACNTNRLRY